MIKSDFFVVGRICGEVYNILFSMLQKNHKYGGTVIYGITFDNGANSVSLQGMAFADYSAVRSEVGGAA